MRLYFSASFNGLVASSPHFEVRPSSVDGSRREPGTPEIVKRFFVHFHPPKVCDAANSAFRPDFPIFLDELSSSNLMILIMKHPPQSMRGMFGKQAFGYSNPSSVARCKASIRPCTPSFL